MHSSCRSKLTVRGYITCVFRLRLRVEPCANPRIKGTCVIRALILLILLAGSSITIGRIPPAERYHNDATTATAASRSHLRTNPISTCREEILHRARLASNNHVHENNTRVYTERSPRAPPFVIFSHHRLLNGFKTQHHAISITIVPTD